MRTIQIVLDEDLLRAADRVTRRARVNRSALIRKALREHLKRIEVREQELRDRQGYRNHPPAGGEFSGWERVAAWPED